jgi:hypothetical protein
MMTKGFQLKTLDLNFLTEYSEFWQFSVYEIHMGDKGDCITAFCANTTNKDTLERDWQEVTDCINNEYLTGVDSDFEHWNSYLLFIVDEKIIKSDGLLFQIENDKFYMRKIVEHNVQGDISEDQIITMLDRKILSAGISYPVIAQPDQVSNNRMLAKPELIYQESLIAIEMLVDMTNAAKTQRQKWLVNELERVKKNED